MSQGKSGRRSGLLGQRGGVPQKPTQGCPNQKLVSRQVGLNLSGLCTELMNFRAECLTEFDRMHCLSGG
jgi:hypothetical protein